MQRIEYPVSSIEEPVTSDPNGIIVVNKPIGLTSARVVSIVKKALNAKKVGHAGTLDPFAEAC